MSYTKRMYEEWLEEQDRQAAEEAGPALIDGDGNHLTNCECPDCLEFDRLLAKANA